MTAEEAKKIFIEERDSLKANPMIKVEDCLYEAFDVAIKALETVNEFEIAGWLITGGRLNGRAYAYKCGLAAGKRSLRWIPCTERLPEKLGEPVLVTVEKYDKRWVEIMYKRIDDGWTDNFDNYTDEVVAWMPLPEPYKKEEIKNGK